MTYIEGSCQLYYLKPWNKPFPSCLLPQFQDEFSCETIQMETTLLSIKMDVQVKDTFI